MFEEEYTDSIHGEEHESLYGSDSFIADSSHSVINEHEDTTDYPEPSAPYNPSFGQGLLVDMPDDAPDGTLAPYDDSVSTNLIHRVKDPFGIYTIKNTYGFSGAPEIEEFEDVHLDSQFDEHDLQKVCNTICDALHWKRLPVFMTDGVANAAYSPGLFTHRTFDDALYLNPSYAESCIQHIGRTDIVVSDMAHEIGHSVAFNICGDQGTFMNEKTADFVSGFVNGKLGVDIDAARQWFEWYYDSKGEGGYPVSEERWDAEAAGYYFSHLANGDDLQTALKDPNFLDIIEAYKTDRLELVNQMAWDQTPHTSESFWEKLSDYKDGFMATLTKQGRYIFGPTIARILPI